MNPRRYQIQMRHQEDNTIATIDSNYLKKAEALFSVLQHRGFIGRLIDTIDNIVILNNKEAQ